MGETGNFRSRLFGGFDRQDVSDYIAALAAERNELLEKYHKLEDEREALSLRAETAEALAEAERLRADEFIVNARRAAADELRALRDKYDGVRADMDVTASHTRCELERMAGGLTQLAEVFGKYGERLGELFEIVDGGGDVAAEESAEAAE